MVCIAGMWSLVAGCAGDGDGKGVAPVIETVILVKADGTGDYPTIQAAIDAADSADVIELEDGTYTGDGNRDLAFFGKAITVTGKSRDPELCIIDCEGTEEEPHRGFYFHTEEGPLSLLHAVTVTGGYHNSGGAIFCMPASPTIDNCRFVENAADYGGAISCADGTPTLVECIFSDNAAQYGGGLYYEDASPIVEDCLFVGNSAAEVGGGAFCRMSTSSSFDGCVFSHNVATLSCGGMACDVNTSVELTNCTFAHNSGGLAGGGFGCGHGSEPVLTNCTFYGGDADYGGGIVCDVASPTVSNTIIAFSTRGGAMSCWGESNPALTCCDIYGNTGGDWTETIAGQLGQAGNIARDPLCCDPDNENLHLRPDSPCCPDSSACGLMGAWPVGCD
jgi:hypothetical protein